MNTTYTISDLSVAAYLSMRGLKLIKAVKSSSGKFEFIFDDLNNEAEDLTLEYFNSEFCKFDNSIRTIKKLLYTNNRSK